MASNSQRVLRVAEVTMIYSFIAFTLLCWGVGGGKLEPWKPLTVGACLSAWALTLACSFAVWRPHRPLALFGLIAALLWMIWALTPRLG